MGCSKLRQIIRGLITVQNNLSFDYYLWLNARYQITCLFMSKLFVLESGLLFQVSYLATYIVGSRGASQLGGSLLGIPLGYKANKLWFH